jgi:thiol-disulfide isomerase/thioredoxin
MLQVFGRTLKAEYIKTKASGLKWLCLGAAIFIPLIMFLFRLLITENDFVGKPQNPWMDFIEGGIGGFAPFFYPLLCVLIIVRLAQFEHKADAWKLLETQPVPRAALYFSKWIACLVIAFICLLLLLLFLILFVFILSLVHATPEFKTSEIHLGQALALITRIWIAGFGLMALQYVLSIAIPNFIGPFIIGLIGTIGGNILSGFDTWPWWMYSGPGNTAKYFRVSNDWMLPHEQMSILFMLIFLFLGYRLFVHKKFKYAFFQPASRIALVLGVVAVFAFCFWFINRPRQLHRGSTTVIAGKIETKDKIDKAYLLDLATRDTIQVIDVAGNKFSTHVQKQIEPSYYVLKMGDMADQVFMGNGDSLFIDAKIDEIRSKRTITGTRLAENMYSAPGNMGDNFWFLENMAYQFKPEQYAKQVLSEWKSGEKKLDKYKTVNNIKPADDFIAIQKKMLRLKLLELLDQHYPKVFRVYYPNQTLQYPASVDDFRKATPVNDSTLLFSDQYIGFLENHYRATSRTANDSGFYAHVTQNIPAGKVKDIFLYRSLSQYISRIGDSTWRQYFIDRFGTGISSQRLVNSLKEKNTVLNNMKRGRPAPDIQAETLAGQPFKLSDLKNRFVVLDVWATWCGPCKKEAPYFKDLAERYTSEDIAFVSLSIDEKKNDWKVQAGGKAEKVLQLWAKNAKEEVGKNYNAEYIPRFILIDNKGRIVNAQMPKPSDPEFENILRKETAFLYTY